MQLFFLSGSKRLFQCVSATNMLEEAALERNCAIFSASNMQLLERLLWSEIERFLSFEHAALFFCMIEEAALERC